MISHHLGQYKGNFYVMDEVVTAKLLPTKAPVTRMHFIILSFQIDPHWLHIQVFAFT